MRSSSRSSITPPSLFHFHLNEMSFEVQKNSIAWWNFRGCEFLRLLSAVRCIVRWNGHLYSTAGPSVFKKKRPAWHRKSLNCRRLLSFFFRTFSEIVTYSHHSTRGEVAVNDTRGGHVVKKLNYAAYYFPTEGINI